MSTDPTGWPTVEPRATAETVEFAEHIRRLVDQAPPLTAAQKVKLSALLRPAVQAQAGGDGMNPREKAAPQHATDRPANSPTRRPTQRPTRRPRQRRDARLPRSRRPRS